MLAVALDRPDTEYEQAVWLIARSPSWRAKGLTQVLGRLSKAERQQAWKDGRRLRRRARNHRYAELRRR